MSSVIDYSYSQDIETHGSERTLVTFFQHKSFVRNISAKNARLINVYKTDGKKYIIQIPYVQHQMLAYDMRRNLLLCGNRAKVRISGYKQAGG
jgi:hypothetical protein